MKGKFRVLLVDDGDFEVVPLYMDKMVRPPDYEFVGVPSSDQAKALLDTQEWDLLITDLKRQGDSRAGEELIAWTRDHFPKLPIFLISGACLSLEILSGFGADVVLKKPMLFSTVFQIVDKFLRSRGEKHL